ncbi:MAG: CDP-alcohol phosphatidyltransferase family protein [Hyphomicrobiales bacterium]|nr:CDP-alcohol phosphatidyltransferase family protein [Hyphomicrobiales bacterium]
MIDGRFVAFGVHGLTALGIVLGFQALLEVAAHRWEAAFAWLGAALIIDGVDGPLARKVGVTEKLPRFSGDRLDLIIDYITYVLIPAFIIYEAQLMPDGFGWLGTSLVLLSSLFHFIDVESKTRDGFFVGFPALWNVVAFYMLAFAMPAGLNIAIIAILAALTLVPLKWIHPVRVVRLRKLTSVAVIAWGMAAIAIVYQGFPASPLLQAVIAVSTVYLLAVGLLRSVRGDVASNPQL